MLRGKGELKSKRDDRGEMAGAVGETFLTSAYTAMLVAGPFSGTIQSAGCYL